MPTTTALGMKLLIDRKTQRVLFAEASKEVVDFIFSLLALPVATVVKLVGKQAMVGCVSNLYTSVDKLDSTYVQADATKDALLCPIVLSPAATTNSFLLRLSPAPWSGQPKSYFKCGYGCSSVTDGSGTVCPTCRKPMRIEVEHTFVPSSSRQQAQSASTGGGKGFVQGTLTYMVMDNLTVTPMSAISSITLLNTFAVRDIGDLQEKTVQLGFNEGLAILKASLQSKSVLTDVFLHGNNDAPGPGGCA